MRYDYCRDPMRLPSKRSNPSRVLNKNIWDGEIRRTPGVDERFLTQVLYRNPSKVAFSGSPFCSLCLRDMCAENSYMLTDLSNPLGIVTSVVRGIRSGCLYTVYLVAWVLSRPTTERQSVTFVYRRPIHWEQLYTALPESSRKSNK